MREIFSGKQNLNHLQYKGMRRNSRSLKPKSQVCINGSSDFGAEWGC